MPEFEPIKLIDGEFVVEVIRTENKHSRAVIKENSVLIKIPSIIKQGKAEDIATELYKRVRRAILKHPERYSYNRPSYLSFADGDSISVLGNVFTMHICGSENKRASARITGYAIKLSIPLHYERRSAEVIAAKLARKAFAKATTPALTLLVNKINSEYFKSDIGEVRVRAGTTRWGSCSRNNNISINFKLLFLPQKYLEYVIVHELAHTKYRNHSTKFWAKVRDIMPDYIERRKWLNSKTLMPSAVEKQSYNAERAIGFQNLSMNRWEQ